jgi:hypothetical protein
VTPIATCIKWFPDMRGTITGLAVFGFGAGTLVFGPLISKLIASSGISNAFFAVGVIMLIGVCGAGTMFKVPPAGYKPAGWNPPPVAAGTVVKIDWTPGEMTGNAQFYILWLIYFVGAAAGLMIIGQAVPIGVEVAKLDKAMAATGLGTMALLNGLGRLVHGSISDKIGRKNTVILMFGEYLFAFLFLLPHSDSFAKWLVGICIVGFAYGGYLALPVHGLGHRGNRRPVHDRRDPVVHRRVHQRDVLHLRGVPRRRRAGPHLQEAGVQGTPLTQFPDCVRQPTPGKRPSRLHGGAVFLPLSANTPFGMAENRRYRLTRRSRLNTP